MTINFSSFFCTILFNFYFCQKRCCSIETNPEYFEYADSKDWSELFPTRPRPVQRWNGTKPPFPRTTQEVCTKKFIIKFPKQVVHLKAGQRTIVERRPIKVTKQMFAFPPSEEVPTLFELLDRIIYKALDNPELGYSEKLLKNIDMFYHYLQLVKGMYIDQKEEKLEAMRHSVYKLSILKGGPTFTRFPINITENRKKLSEAFNWNEKDFEVIKKRQETVENMWYRVQMNIFDMNQLSQLQEQLNETGKRTTEDAGYNHQPPRRWMILG